MNIRDKFEWRDNYDFIIIDIKRPQQKNILHSN